VVLPWAEVGVDVVGGTVVADVGGGVEVMLARLWGGIFSVA